MDKVKPGHFYVLGIGDREFWGVPLHYAGSSDKEIITLEYNKQFGRWKETVWGRDQFVFAVEVKKLENTIPFNTMKDNDRRKTVKAVLRR